MSADGQVLTLLLGARQGMEVLGQRRALCLKVSSEQLPF